MSSSAYGKSGMHVWSMHRLGKRGQSQELQKTPEWSWLPLPKVGLFQGAAVVSCSLGLGFLHTLTWVKSPPLKSIPSLFLPLEIAHSEVVHLVQQLVLRNCIGLCHLKDDFCVCVYHHFLNQIMGSLKTKPGKSCFQNPCHLVIWFLIANHLSNPNHLILATFTSSYLVSQLPLLPFTAPHTSLVLSLPLLKNHNLSMGSPVGSSGAGSCPTL